MPRIAPLCALPFLLVTACGGESTSFDTAPPPASVPLEDVPARYAEAYCSVVERCTGILYELVFSLEDCQTLAAETTRQSGFPAIEAAVDDGRIVYHADEAEACFDAVEARDCAKLNDRGIDECEAALGGTVAEDGACEIDEECVGSLICKTDGACPGTCVERYRAGEPCRENDECADGLVCSSATAYCVAPAGLGELCEGRTEPQCETGLICLGNDNAAMQPGWCRPLDAVSHAGAGDGCDPSQGALCGDGLSCVVIGVGAGLATVWQCQPIPASGGPCHLGVPENCPTGEHCPLTLAAALQGTEGECERPPAPGEACGNRPLGFLAACEAYARCENERCVALRDLGASCETSAVCYSGSCVDGACVPPRSCE